MEKESFLNQWKTRATRAAGVFVDVIRLVKNPAGAYEDFRKMEHLNALDAAFKFYDRNIEDKYSKRAPDIKGDIFIEFFAAYYSREASKEYYLDKNNPPFETLAKCPLLSRIFSIAENICRAREDVANEFMTSAEKGATHYKLVLRNLTILKVTQRFGWDDASTHKSWYQGLDQIIATDNVLGEMIDKLVKRTELAVGEADRVRSVAEEMATNYYTDEKAKLPQREVDKERLAVMYPEYIGYDSQDDVLAINVLRVSIPQRLVESMIPYRTDLTFRSEHLN